MIKTTIFDFLQNYHNKRYHTPGHKGNLPFGLGALDLTEIDQGDLFPGALVDKAQARTAQLFGVGHCRYLVGGSSLGIKAALMAVGEDVLAFGSVHKSVYDGCKLAGKNLFLCGATGTSVETTQGCTQPSQLAASLTVQDLKDAFAKYPTVCAVAFTSPDYFGRVIEREVWEFARSQKKIILNDAAHGAHFLFAGLQDFAYFGFADITITSAHKTLATLTQGALSLVANEGLLQRFEHCLDLLGTTSPSYLLLASIEYGVEYAYHNQKKYVALQEVLASLKQSIYTLDNADYTRLVVDCKHYGMCGKQVFDALVQRGIVAEMYTEQYLVFIVTICDSVADIETLQKALHDILKITNQ